MVSLKTRSSLEELAFNFVVERLLVEEKRQRNDSENAFVVRDLKVDGGRRSGSNVRCFYCMNLGHVKAKCYARQLDGLKHQNQPPEDDTGTAALARNGFTFVARGQSINFDWYLNLGATTLMTPNKGIFFFYPEVANNPRIILGNSPDIAVGLAQSYSIHQVAT